MYPDDYGEALPQRVASSFATKWRASGDIKRCRHVSVTNVLKFSTKGPTSLGNSRASSVLLNVHTVMSQLRVEATISNFVGRNALAFCIAHDEGDSRGDAILQQKRHASSATLAKWFPLAA